MWKEIDGKKETLTPQKSSVVVNTPLAYICKQCVASESEVHIQDHLYIIFFMKFISKNFNKLITVKVVIYVGHLH